MNIRKYINAVTLLSLFISGNSIVAMESLPDLNLKTKLAEFNDCKSNKLKEFSEKLDTDFDILITQITGSHGPGGLVRSQSKTLRSKYEIYLSPCNLEKNITDDIKKRENTWCLTNKDLYRVVAGYVATKKALEVNCNRRFSSHFWTMGPMIAPLTANTGWKIHVAPNLLCCQPVLTLVDDLQTELKFNYKVVNSLPLYRLMNYSNFNREYGKFIVIYPNSDKEAHKITDRLHELFVKHGLDGSCFLHLPHEFKIYDGIYSRLTFYKCATSALEKEEEFYRTHIGVNPKALKKHADDNNCPVNEYQHPFPALYAKVAEVPKKANEINTFLDHTPTP